MLESTFKTNLIQEIRERMPGSMIFHLDPRECRGIPDLIVLYKDKWAALEGKQHGYSSKRPLQDYYVNQMNEMSFARFIDQDNKEEVLDDLVRSFGA